MIKTANTAVNGSVTFQSPCTPMSRFTNMSPRCEAGCELGHTSFLGRRMGAVPTIRRRVLSPSAYAREIHPIEVIEPGHANIAASPDGFLGAVPLHAAISPEHLAVNR